MRSLVTPLVALSALGSIACARPAAPVSPPPLAWHRAAIAASLEPPAKNIQATAQDLKALVVGCYQIALIDDPNTEGELSYSLALAGNGSVLDTNIHHEGTCGALFLLCVETALQSLQFAPSEGGKLARVEGKLSFARREE